MAEPKKKFVYTDHPSITLVGKKPHLRIFEDFFIEEKLPKFCVKRTKDGKYVTPDSANLMDEEGGEPHGGPDDATESRDMYELKRVLEGIGQHTSTTSSARWDRDRYVRNKLREFRLEEKDKVEKAKSGCAKIFEKLGLKNFSVKEPNVKLPTIEESFEWIKKTFEIPSSELMEKHKRLIDAAIERLTKVGQTAKASEIEKHAFILAGELALAKDARFAKYLTEDQIIKLMMKAEKGINIEFIRYYNELIPTDVIEKKLEADKLCIFDNYAIIHYDKTVENFRQTVTIEEERRDRIRRRDPILVGLIQGSRKLYFIADWETEQDDLTLEKVEELIGAKAPILSAFESEIKNQEENAKVTDAFIAQISGQFKNIQTVNTKVNDDVDL